MPEDFLGDRKKALEDQFFDKENRKLIERLREQERRQAAREGLAEISGISDGEVLDRLVSVGIHPDTWAALALVPLVEVAWANGKVEERERRAILAAAESNGIEPGSPSHELLAGWLERRPDARLLEAWGELTVELCSRLDAHQREALRREILDRARSVAEAAGGLLGLVNKVSREEEVVLAELEKAFRAR